MTAITTVLPYIQIILSILLCLSILLQQSGAGLGGAMGGGDGNTTFHTRRGFEKLLFRSTILFAVLFVISAILAVIL